MKSNKIFCVPTNNPNRIEEMDIVRETEKTIITEDFIIRKETMQNRWYAFFRTKTEAENWIQNLWRLT